MKFIEITDPNGAKILINVFKVNTIQKTNIGPQRTVSITMDNGRTIYATGKYEDFISLLEIERT